MTCRFTGQMNNWRGNFDSAASSVTRPCRMREHRGEGNGSAKLLANDELEARPHVGNGVDLHVNESHGKGHVANDILRHVRRHLGGANA